MIYLSAEVISALGDDTFWTWFIREIQPTRIGQPRISAGSSDVVLRYSTLGKPRFPERSIALLWELYPEMKEAFQSHQWDQRLEKIEECARACRYRVVASALTAKNYEQFGPVDVLPIGVDTDLFTPLDNKQCLRQKYGIPQDKRVGIWGGTTHPMKGFQRLLEWKRDNPDVYWIIIWKWDQEADHLDGAHNFVRVDQGTLAELMNCADFFLSCGMLDPFYMIEWEAMACNLPMVILDGRKKDFVPSANPRNDVFSHQWDRPTARKRWINYINERFPDVAAREQTPRIAAPSRAPVDKPRRAPRVSIVSLIYQSPEFADAVYNSVTKNTPMLVSGEAEFLFVANDPTDKLVEHLRRHRYPHHVFRNPRRTEDELLKMGYGKPEYLHRVYRGYNEGIRRAAGEIVVLINSDNMFSPGWLENLLKNVRPDTIVSSQLVERNHPRFGVFPAAYEANFGAHPREFRERAFRRFCRRRSLQGTSEGGALMPCACYKSTLEAAGLYPEGNLADGSFDKVAECGDVALFARLANQDVKHITALDSIVYHFKEGEKDNIRLIEQTLQHARQAIAHVRGWTWKYFLVTLRFALPSAFHSWLKRQYEHFVARLN